MKANNQTGNTTTYFNHSYLVGVFNFGDCPRKSSPTLLNCSSAVVLFVGPILWTLTSVLFLVGGISDKLICQTLQEPENSESVLYNSINSALNKTLSENLPSNGEINHNFTIDGLLESCKEGKGLLEVFKIKVDWDESLATHGNIRTDQIRNNITSLVDKGIDKAVESLVLNSEIQNSLEKIGKDVSESLLQKNGSKFQNAINTNVSETLKHEELQSVKTDFQSLGFNITEMNNIITEIDNVENQIQNQLIPHVDETKKFLKKYKNALFYNATCDLSCATNEIKTNIEDARQYISQTTRTHLIQIVKNFVNRLISLGKKHIFISRLKHCDKYMYYNL